MRELEEFLHGMGDLKYLYNRLDELSPTLPISEQLLNLGEDLFQAQFQDGTVVDVGFYPWAPNGVFRVSVIRDDDWDHPVKQFECKEVKEMCSHLRATLTEVSTRFKHKNAS